MSARPEIPADTSRKQELVSNPEVSAWVSANAGSGKTTVLVRRVIRLLLRDVQPAKILCLTFTKAAAANMANKVLGTLAEWVRLDDAALDQKLARVTPEKSSPALRARARRLFAAALETPGGLKVQTIHAFCDRVLHQFPFEARVPAGFEVLDDVSEGDLLRRARDAVMIGAATDTGSALGRALATVVAAASDDSFEKALAEAVRARRKVKSLNQSGAGKPLAASLGLQPGETVDAVTAEILNSANLARSEWASVASVLAPFGGNAAKCAERLQQASTARDDASCVECYFIVFFKSDGGPRDESGFAADKVRKSAPDLFDRIFAERDRLIKLRDKLFAARALERTKALLTLASATIERFEAAKHARGALDYTDLIEKTADMLNDRGSEWVLYKLDGGIDHVLVDEAQDTSPEQWNVIGKLTEEFFAGKGARENRDRTIFAVGDDKQSIFSFQGAVPKQFGEMKNTFQKLVEGAGSKFHPETLDLSFRSAPVVLKAVDKVFERPEVYADLSSGEQKKPVHEAIRDSAPALVEIWNTEKREQADDDSLAWDAPLNATSEASPAVKLAKRIAKAIKFWTGGGLSVEDRKTEKLRTPTAGDVIVLVRRRGPLFEAILQALKSEGVPVAGADRLKLSEHIAVMDLAALGEALMLEADDFSLACALKSPLFGLTDDDLFEIAHKRTGTLTAALDKQAESDPRFKAISMTLARWRREAASLRPFDFYSRVLGRDRGRELMLARLGHEAADAIDEFLASALAYEQTETPSLVGFLNFLRRAGTEVKRDLEMESNAVRVMTVHGAKGLEAPLVILADTTTIPEGRNTRLHDLGDAFVWAGKKDFDSSCEQAARDAAETARKAEYRRLLYVALTRAADALIICGAEGNRKLDDGCWYRLVRDALEAGEPSQLVETETEYGKVLRWRPHKFEPAAQKETAIQQPVKIPDALERAAPASREGATRVRPSDYETGIEAADQASGKSGPRLDPRRRGDLLHRLLQFLPEQAEAERETRAKNFLKSAAADLSEQEQTALAAEALALLAHPGMSALQGARSLPEVSFLLRDPARNSEISGRIDRLFAKDSEIIIVDYKTDANPPKTAEQVPVRYRRQLALYREAIGRIYPGKTIRTLLVYSTGPLVHELTL